MRLSFLGAAGTVTGSKYLLESATHRLLIDCGLFQGARALRQMNWEALAVAASSVSTVVLTHAHLDHSGALPLLVKQGFSGTIVCSEATAALCEILLLDSAHLQEQDARYANKRSYTKHKPALPLYTVKDAEGALRLLRPIPFHESQALPGGARIVLRRAGHILGAASVEFEWEGRTVAFSGDLGRYNEPIMFDPEPLLARDYLIVEFDVRQPASSEHRSPNQHRGDCRGDHKTRRYGGHSCVCCWSSPDVALLLPADQAEWWTC